MTALTLESPQQSTRAVRDPAPLRWTSEDYERLTEQGWFDGRRVELVDGEILEMAAQRHPHAASMILTRNILQRFFEPTHTVRDQLPLHIVGSAPEPDFAVVQGSIRSYTSHPTTALLVVEVSDTTLAYDLGWKATLYARAEIPDYWVLDVDSRRLIVHRRPDAATGAWGEKFVVDERGQASPLACPQATINVADMLP